MEWFEIVFYVSLAVLVIQVILSFVLGDLDIDHDLDVAIDHDFTFGDVLSFKGLVHFIVGFTSVLTVAGKPETGDYVGGFFVGLLFMFILSWCYNFIHKKLRQELVYTTELEDVDAEVYYWDSVSQTGEVFVILEGRKVQVHLRCEEGVELKNGDKIKVSGTRTIVYKV